MITNDNASTRYHLAVERERSDAMLCPIDFLEAYISHYESTRSYMGKMFTKVCDTMGIASEPPKIVGFRKALDERLGGR